MEHKLAEIGVPNPVSFAWPSSLFGPEAIAQLKVHGYQLARRGTNPEYPTGYEESQVWR
jgi:hypothetical protein